MAGQTLADETQFSIATVPPTPRERRLAIAIIIVLIIGFSVTAPFAPTQLTQINSFVPAVEAMNFVTDLVTAGLLFSIFPLMGARAVLVLASGYLFSSLTVVPHVQTTPWLYTFWHLGFCASVPLTAKPRMLHVRTEPHGLDAITICIEDTGPGSTIFSPALSVFLTPPPIQEPRRSMRKRFRTP